MKLFTLNGIKNFKEVNKAPLIGDDFSGLGCEVIDIESVKLDDTLNSRVIFDYNENDYRAYRVLFINRGCEEERENPMEDYIVTVN